MALLGKRVSYEVLTGEGSRWILDAPYDHKPDAMTRAQSLLDSNQHDAVKVTRLVNDQEEDVVFLKECASKVEKPITISPIEESAVCNKADDVSGFEARKTTGRLLRQYLDEWGITALELLHNFGHIRQLMRMETLYDQALHRLASVQARRLNEEPSKRTDTLYKLAGKIENKARKLEGVEPYVTTLKEKGLAAALNDIDAQIEAKKQTFFTGAVLGEYLSKQRDWKQKLALVFDLIERESDPRSVDILDQIVAEILDGSEAVKDLLGPQPDLVSALRIMVQLCSGTYKKGQAGDTPIGRLNALLANRPMPYTKGGLYERVARAVSGTGPLTRQDEAADKQAFIELFNELIGPGGLKGGVLISEALTRRTRMVMKSDDQDLSPDGGIASVLSMLPNGAVKIGYLLDLSHSDFGIQYQVGVLKPLMLILESVSSLSGLLPAGAANEDIIAAVDDMRRRIGEGTMGQEIGSLIDAKLKNLLKGLEDSAEAPAEPEKAPPPAAAKQPAKGDLGERVFAPGDIIFNEGEAGDEAFMIVSGEVEIAIKSGERDIVLATLDRGQIIGEMALVDNQPRMATAKALKETMLTVIPQEAFRKRLDWLAGEDRLISHLLTVFVDRLRKQARNL